MREPLAPRLSVGMEFNSTCFSVDVKIIAIRTEHNQLDVEMTPSDRHSWVEKDWNLQLTVRRFELGEYKPKLHDTTNYSVI